MGVVERTNLRNLYLYLVCLVTLIIAIFATVNVVRDAVQLVYPDPGYYGVPVPLGPTGQVGQPSPPDLQSQQRAARASQRRQAVLGLVGSATMLLVAGPLYLWHWRRVQSEVPHRRAGSRANEQPTAQDAD